MSALLTDEGRNLFSISCFLFLAFLAELPLKGNLGGLLSVKRTDAGRSIFMRSPFLIF